MLYSPTEVGFRIAVVRRPATSDWRAAVLSGLGFNAEGFRNFRVWSLGFKGSGSV